MVSVQVTDQNKLEKFFRIFKRMVQQEGLKREAKRRNRHETPSEKRKRKKRESYERMKRRRKKK